MVIDISIRLYRNWNCQNEEKMKQLISLLFVITSITGLYGKDTYEKVFETIGVIVVDLNQDGYPDSLVLEKLFYIDSETGKKTDEPGDFHRITFVLNNKRIVKFNKGGWVKNERRKEKGDSIFNIHTNLFFTLRLPENRIGLVFTSYPYASDPEKHTIYTVSEDAEIETVYDAYFYITEFKDVNSDGIKEIIGPIGYYGDINPDKTFVPYKIYIIKDTFEFDENLSYAYNLQLKNYRDYPEVSIKKCMKKN